MSNELILRTGCYLTTPVGTEVVRKSTNKEWQSYGEILRRVEEAKQWAIGDWLVDGKRHYGDGLYKKAAEITGLSANTLMSFASLSSAFELSLRRENLCYGHHKEVQGIKLIAEGDDGKLHLSDEPDQDKIAELLAEAEKRGWSVVELREQVRTHKEWQRQHIAAANEPEKYAVIYADPPWQYTSGDQHSTEEQETVLEDHYPSMKLADICALPQAELAATDCVLFLWCTSPTLEEAISIIDAWGFKYKTCAFTWVKVRLDGVPLRGMGSYTKSNIEICLLGMRGHIKAIDKTIPQILMEPRRGHSVKPPIVRDRIVQLFGDLSRIELFARQRTLGWDVWGNEV